MELLELERRRDDELRPLLIRGGTEFLGDAQLHERLFLVETEIVAAFQVADEMHATSQRPTRYVEQAMRWPEALCDEEVELQAPDFLPEPPDVVAMTEDADAFVAFGREAWSSAESAPDNPVQPRPDGWIVIRKPLHRRAIELEEHARRLGDD